MGRSLLCGGYVVEWKAKVAANNKASHISPLAFVKYVFHNVQTLNNIHHMVYKSCADVEAMLDTKLEKNFWRTQTLRAMPVNQFLLFRTLYRQKHRSM